MFGHHFSDDRAEHAGQCSDAVRHAHQDAGVARCNVEVVHVETSTHTQPRLADTRLIDCILAHNPTVLATADRLPANAACINTGDGESAEADSKRETRDGSDRVCRVAHSQQEHRLHAKSFHTHTHTHIYVTLSYTHTIKLNAHISFNPSSFSSLGKSCRKGYMFCLR